jgi:hypothetical protein
MEEETWFIFHSSTVNCHNINTTIINNLLKKMSHPELTKRKLLTKSFGLLSKKDFLPLKKNLKKLLKTLKKQKL